ncbi:MAG: beta galactosidase jelly roll domain-containing protein [Lachnospiraceae bacterium]|nr:beta galactosidase jelly roll domain-containing protein [Lachnospiraceae bacterium]
MSIDLYAHKSPERSDVVWDVYPRPKMVRDSFLNLNGEWTFCDAKITVPFCPESSLSGLGILLDDNDVLFYERAFTLPEGIKKGRILLHFGAVDQVADVYLNGYFLGRHEGGYTHFSFDVTDKLQNGENHLKVRVEDRLDDCVHPYGKQRHKRGGMWYTPVTGIWQTVWMECVPDHHIRDILMRTEGNRVHIALNTEGEANAILYFDGQTYRFTKKIDFEVENPHFWTPEDPYLYEFGIDFGADHIESYLCLRDISVGEVSGVKRLFLNGKPYYFHGVLDQGYFSDGIYTPKDPEAYRKDIEQMKECGFNMLRKHIKIEPDYFYYLCDKLGMAVFQDMVENGRYSFIRDTVLPTVAPGRRVDDEKLHTDPATRKAFLRSVRSTVGQLRNFGCIVYWTVFNEGWGQFCGTQVYRYLKKLDRTRIVDTASGWFSGCESDVHSVHVYFKKVAVKKTEKPFVLSEYGGYSWRVPGHSFSEKAHYGYRDFKTIEAYREGLKTLLVQDVLMHIPEGLSADVLTQLSDVEDEINGLLTYDREVLKVDAGELREIAEKMKEAVRKVVEIHS